ncbi:MAG: DUF4040 domain-containing protein [Phormidesmis sp.]
MTSLTTADFYMVAITALLPLTAILLVLQVNPYQALVIRGILGAIAALVYALFGAADVALTEALVGTMLSITLYAVAVRSSMVMQIGAIATEPTVPSATPDQPPPSQPIPSPLPQPLVSALEESLNKHHVRLEILTYPDASAMMAALKSKEIHASYYAASDSGSNREPSSGSSSDSASETLVLETLKSGSLGSLKIRVRHLYDIFRSDLIFAVALTYVDLATEKTNSFEPRQSNLVGESP